MLHDRLEHVAQIADQLNSKKMAIFTYGKQNHCCKECGRQFVLEFDKKIISDEKKKLIEKLLLEKTPLRGI